MQDVRAGEPELDDEIASWEQDHPECNDVYEFYETYVWAVYFTGMKVSVIEAKEDEIAAALRNFDFNVIAGEPEPVRQELLAVIGHRQKADAVIKTAIRLHERPELWDELRQLPKEAVLERLREFPYIGPQNRYHIARNLGWDVPMYGGFTLTLAEALQTDCETLVQNLAQASGYRLNTTDTLLGVWSRLHEAPEDCVTRVQTLLGLD